MTSVASKSGMKDTNILSMALTRSKNLSRKDPIRLSRYFNVERTGNEQQISDNYLLITELNAYKSYGNVAADII